MPAGGAEFSAVMWIGGEEGLQLDQGFEPDTELSAQQCGVCDLGPVLGRGVRSRKIWACLGEKFQRATPHGGFGVKQTLL